MKLVQYAMTIFLAWTLSSCDPQGCEVYAIHNLSSDTVVINGGLENELNVGPGLKYTSNEICGLGIDGTIDMLQYTSLENDTIISKKDIFDVQQWRTIQISKLKWEHSFEITDSDF